MNLLKPKDRILENPDTVTYLNNIVYSDRFKDIVSDALAQMQLNLPRSSNPSESWDNQNRMEGAKLFINTLLNIGTAEEAPPVQKPKTLNPYPKLPEPKITNLKK